MEISIFCFGEIGFETTLSSVIQQAQSANDGDTVNVIINSPGGMVDEGYAIHDYLVGLKSKGVTVNTEIYGMCASIATVIALAGENRVMTENSQFMIHNPWTQVQGDASELKVRADELEKVENQLAQFYSNQTGQKVEKLIGLMAAESYFTPEQAKKLGFITEIKTSIKAVAKINSKPKQNQMSNQNKGIIARIQSLFKALEDGTDAPKAMTTTLEDGTEIVIETELETPEIGDAVTVNGEPAPDGTHTLANGTVITTEGGVIMSVTVASAAEDKEEEYKAKIADLQAQLETSNAALKEFEAKLSQTTKAFAQARKGFNNAKPVKVENPNAPKFTKDDLKKTK